VAGGDCDDADGTSNPGASEVCDGNDNDCAGGVPLTEVDNDGDLYVECTPWVDTQGDQPAIVAGGDCDDADGTSNPGASEVCDGNDNDCAGGVPLTEVDNDGDLYVECTPWVDTQGDQPTIVAGGDCDDADGTSNPGASEVCDGNDNDCAGGVPLTEVDNDGDLYVECTPWVDTQGDQPTIVAGGDCDDTSSTVNPGATEICANGVDDDCDTMIDEAGCSPSTPFPPESQITMEGGSLTWTVVPGATSYHLYRGDLATLRARGAYTQDTATVPNANRFCWLTEVRLDDPFEPAVGETVFFLVTPDTGLAEGSLGRDSNGVERPNEHPCR
jgi:hypothetical protein